MKMLLIALLLTSNICFASPTIDKAIAHLAKADQLLRKNDLHRAAKEDFEVIKTKGLPTEMYSSAYLLMGNIALSGNYLNIAEVAYKRVLALKHAPALDRKAAKSGLNLVGDLRKDQEQEQEQEQPHMYR